MARRRTIQRRARPGAYAVGRAGGVVRIVPRALSGPGLAGQIGAAAGAAAAAAVVGMGVWWVWLSLRHADPDMVPPWWVVWACPVTVLLPLAATLIVASVRLWRSRSTPLVIDPTGRVRHGRRDLISPGTAKTVRLDRTVRRVTDGDGYDAGEIKVSLVYVECSDGRFVALPGPYFFDFEGWVIGLELAAALGAALHVPVSTGPAANAGLGSDDAR